MVLNAPWYRTSPWGGDTYNTYFWLCKNTTSSYKQAYGLALYICYVCFSLMYQSILAFLLCSQNIVVLSNFLVFLLSSTPFFNLNFLSWAYCLCCLCKTNRDIWFPNYSKFVCLPLQSGINSKTWGSTVNVASLDNFGALHWCASLKTLPTSLDINHAPKQYNI